MFIHMRSKKCEQLCYHFTSIYLDPYPYLYHLDHYISEATLFGIYNVVWWPCMHEVLSLFHGLFESVLSEVLWLKQCNSYPRSNKEDIFWASFGFKCSLQDSCSDWSSVSARILRINVKYFHECQTFKKVFCCLINGYFILKMFFKSFLLNYNIFKNHFTSR